jgi:phosphatidylserine decarboxylase
VIAAATLAVMIAAVWAFWRYYWFYRDPPRFPPEAPGLVSAADGTVVYVKRVPPHAEVVVIKEGVAATVHDIAREDDGSEKLVIGVFMSPFDIHYNRAPIDGRVAQIRRYPAQPENVYMGEMHWRTVIGQQPLYRGSTHIVQNERAVTRIDGTWAQAPLSVYVVQIGARTVNGIDAFFEPGDAVARGETFGMIRIGSQVDLVVPWREGMQALVREGDRVRAGETLLVR